MKNIFYLLVFATIIFQSCDEDVNSSNNNVETPDLSQKYKYANLALPFGLTNNNINGGINNELPEIKDPNGNTFFGAQPVKVTDAGAALGRVLFYDKKMSINNAISCGSCHLQEKAFSDGQAVSTGFKGVKTTRNSMAILNPIMQNNLFWDSRSHTIHDLTLLPVQNHIEMGMEDLNYLEGKLSAQPYYKALFKEAFNSERITQERITEAMAQFIASITSSESKFDAEVRKSKPTFASFTSLEEHGRNLFFGNKAKCGSCHAGNNFSAPDGVNDEYGGSSGGENLKGTTNIGLDLIAKDLGRKDGSFKIPSLRNIEVTGPYMHDGRFSSLEQVLDHYSSGIKANANLDKKFKDAKGNPKGLDLNTYDKQAIVAFLKTLTDKKFLSDPKYSDPFN
jgi:cytochrome c peroxidase